MTEAKTRRAPEARADEPARLILLDAADNVLIAVRAVAPGDLLVIDGAALAAPENVPAGHKLARTDLRAGEKVLKYGAPIGAATRAVARGAHVHTHNLRSDYIATHSREEDAT
ncbi:UxaA family hydrolase [Amphiplicatus metriothermophilus]|uniref:SAF domain-containing protein n=1 Tax=Amphiplicatus metriothermophilus TaxID=1519374 RepID=A0A239PW09_9PROT|nr:UxaA family hydrolase [Amphiplicatus metriothermophilus]MBB5519650.1 hypothetical protein [Amphiplicatus metriothermophilus]SNT74213.1 SAF domain-containing protein [Amphiplicatus metriothermophilus]